MVAEVGGGEQAVAAVRRLDPHVALVDIRMPRLDGIDATRRIVALDGPTRVIILTTFDVDEYVFAALRAGAAGFLLKVTTADDLVAGVRTVAAGNSMLTPAVTSRVIEAFAATTPGDPDVAIALDLLSTREREVLVQDARGLSNVEIARRLHLGESTVKRTSAACSPNSICETASRQSSSPTRAARSASVTSRTSPQTSKGHARLSRDLDLERLSTGLINLPHLTL